MKHGMSNPRNKIIRLNLSGTSFRFSIPMDFSKDFPLSASDHYNINIYDNDIYTDSANTLVMHQAYWDYGKGFISGKVNGTLAMSLVLCHTQQNDLNIKNENEFIKALQLDFNKNNDQQARDGFDIDPPDNYEIMPISGLQWGHYDYFTGQERRTVYAAALSEQHYLKINFIFIDNSQGQKGKWMKQARRTIDNIMSSFVTTGEY